MSHSTSDNNTDAVIKTLVRTRFYLDSVALMRMSASLARLPDVEDAAMMMATPANREIMSNAGLLETADIDATPADLLICVRGSNEAVVNDALQQAQTMLEQPLDTAAATGWRPRTLRAALDTLPAANLALISVPGAFACSEARKAIRRGLHAMIFSDNVSIAEEAELKREAQSLGRLVMGPDCGTAIVNGIPLAFANHIPRGNVGIVGASGTGIQEVCCLLASAGVGVSHALGVGGRDLSDQVGGISTLMAIDALDRDASTQHVVLISKPPGADVVNNVLQRVAASRKTFTLCFVGGQAPSLPANAQWAPTLASAAALACAQSESSPAALSFQLASDGLSADAVFSSLSDSSEANSNARLVRGLFCGGTLCAEAQVLMLQAGLQVTSNAAIPGVTTMTAGSSSAPSTMHSLIDLGADEFTQGKPHPMIEPSIRDSSLHAALDDPATAVILLDCVIGNGAHADPAGHLVHSVMQWQESCGRSCPVPLLVSVTGTEQDPQVRSRQVETLRAAGIQVAASNASATLDALLLLANR